MKKYFIVIMFLIIICSIFSIEIKDSTKSKTYNIALSYGNAKRGTIGGSIGIGKVQHFDKSTNELTANFHYLMNSDYFVTGIYGQINSYRNKQRNGLFSLIMVGLDYSKGKYKPISFGGSYGTEKFEGIFPNIAIGCGFSMKLSQNNRMLIYIDLGLKKTISNLYVSIIF